MVTPGPGGHSTRPQRSRRGGHRVRSTALVIGAVFLCVLVVASGVAAYRVYAFLHGVANVGNPIQMIQHQVDPPVGSVAYKLKHGQRVTILALGYGGGENDAPWLTDTIMVVSIDPTSQRILEASIPRDLYVRIDAWQDGRQYADKINAAFEVPNMPELFAPGPLRPEFQGKDGAGHLSEATVSRITGLTFDKYAAVDFKAFRDVVDALGGIQVQMDGSLDDCHYPDYHNGYMNHGVPFGWRCPPGAGIHFLAGDYVVNGEQALELARSRDAVQQDQASDFGRAKRQQMIVAAIKKKATSVSALTKAPQLMDALQANFKTDMDLTDVKAIYDFAANLPDTAFQHFAVTNQDLAADVSAHCGPAVVYVLCPIDATYRMWQTVFSHALVDRQTMGEGAPLQLVNASSSYDLQTRATNLLRGFGLQLSDGVRHSSVPKTVIYDYSGGKYPQTTAWLQDFFGGPQVVPATPPSPGVRSGFVPSPGESTEGLVVVMGTDFYRRWSGLG